MNKNKSKAQIYLEQVEMADTIIPNKLIEIQQWYELATSITASMNSEVVQASGSKQKMADAINKCLDIVDELTLRVNQLKAVKKEVTQTIEQLYSPTEYNVLHMRYIQHMELQEIADYYGKDYDWAKVVCKRGCDHVQAILRRQ